jgi:hypothetical protein
MINSKLVDRALALVKMPFLCNHVFYSINDNLIEIIFHDSTYLRNTVARLSYAEVEQTFILHKHIKLTHDQQWALECLTAFAHAILIEKD